MACAEPPSSSHRNVPGMVTRQPREYAPPAKSRKTRLSFLLNDDEEEVATPMIQANTTFLGAQQRISSNNDLSRRERYPAMSRTQRRPEEQRQLSIMPGYSNLPPQRQPRTASVTYPSAMDKTLLHRPLSSSETQASGPEKRGVRKKRQRKFICDTCGFGFYTNSDLQKHISSVHLLLRPYECSMCDKKFGERSNATKHFKSVHERQKNAACEQCHKVFAFRDGLVRHVRLVHDNVRNFHCQYPGCGQSFKQSAHLKKHEQVHNKSRGGAALGVRGGGSSSKKAASPRK